MRAGILVTVLCVAAPFIASAQVPEPMPAPGPATDRASVVLVMRAVNERLAPWSAFASISDSASAWVIRTPGGGPYWERARKWLVTTLHAREPRDARESPRHFVEVTSAVVRGDSLIATFRLGTTFPDQGKSPSTVYRVRAKWSQFAWGRPVIEPTMYLD